MGMVMPVPRGRQAMDRELTELLERSRSIEMTEEQLEEHRIALAVANGYLSDSRVTVDAMKAARTVVEAGNKPK